MVLVQRAMGRCAWSIPPTYNGARSDFEASPVVYASLEHLRRLILGRSLHVANAAPHAAITRGSAIADCRNTWCDTWCDTTSTSFIGGSVTGAPTIAIARPFELM